METVIYVRWSRAEQARGSSKERQLEDCRRHALAKGWDVVEELIDDGFSAYSGRHISDGALGRFVSFVEQGLYPDGVILLTERLDRLSRQDAGHVVAWMLSMINAGVVIATVDGDRRYSRGNFQMAEIIEIVVKAQLAHEESAKKADRLAASWRAKRAKLESGQTLVMTRRAPAWVEVDGDPPAFILVEERAAIVRRIFQETLAGYGKAVIARRLNEEKVAPFGRAIGWHPSYVQKIITSPTVIGELQPGRKARGEKRELVGDPVAGYYPAVIDADTFARAQRTLASRSRRVAGRGRRMVNILSGIARCSCGSKMAFRAKGAKPRADGTVVNEDYLVCDSYQRRRGCLNKQHYRYDAWETAALNALLTRAMGDDHFGSAQAASALERERAELARRREAAVRKANGALDLYLETERDEAKAAWSALTAEVDEYAAKLDVLTAQIRSARGAVTPAEHQTRIFDLFDRMTHNDEETRFQARSRVMEAIHELVEEIVFLMDPQRAEVTTRGGIGATITCTSGRGPTAEFTYRYDEGFFDAGAG